MESPGEVLDSDMIDVLSIPSNYVSDPRHICGCGCQPRSISNSDRSDDLLHEVTERSERTSDPSEDVVHLQLGTLENSR